MNYTAFEILEILTKYDAIAPKDMSDMLDVSYQTIHKALSELHEKGFIRYESPMSPRRIINKEHPFILAFRELMAVDPGYREHISILSKKTLVKILRCFSNNKVLTRKDLAKQTHFSLPVVRTSLNTLLDRGIVEEFEGKPARYSIGKSKRCKYMLNLVELLLNESKKPDKKLLTHKDLIQTLINNNRVHILVHHGSSQFGLNDAKSDIDFFLVVSDRDVLNEIKSIHTDPMVELNPILIESLSVLAKEEPQFLNQLLSGNVLKGRDLLESVMRR